MAGYDATSNAHNAHNANNANDAAACNVAKGRYSRSGDGRMKFHEFDLQPIAEYGGGFFCSTAQACRNNMKTEPVSSNENTEHSSVSRNLMPASDAPHKHAPLWLIVAAFAAVYLVWGSTYLGIRYAVQSIPPFLTAGARHLTAGIVLFAFTCWRGVAAPKWIEWRDAAIAGTLMLVIGNGGVTWAEQRIPSGVAALLVALVPLWMVLIDWLRPNGKRPRAWVGAGLFIGIAGVALLARGRGEHHEAAYGWSVAALMIASISWACGSLFSRSARKPKSPLLAVALQMIAGGAVLLTLAVARGEFGQFAMTQVTRISFLSWLYLTIAGSLIAYTAYVWILQVSTPARVATYAYVNPLIAVLLGCTLGHEVFSRELIAAGALIVLAVILIVRGGAQGAKTLSSTAVSSKLEPVSE